MKHGRQSIISFRPTHDSFVGVDSDGCVFDTMTQKQCDFFHPLIISHWHLEAIEKQVRAAAEFINLRSRSRGINRFPALLMTFELLSGMDGVAESGVKLPDTADLKKYCGLGIPMSNDSLKEESERTGSSELASVLEWSLDVNEAIAHGMSPVPPFEWSEKSLRKMKNFSDIAIVSQTPFQTVLREWEYFRLTDIPNLIAAQEDGSKIEHIQFAAKGKYPDDRILLIGDAPGDMDAACAAGVAFYPVIPGREEEMWQKFYDFYYEEFLAGNFAAHEKSLIDEFLKSLPAKFEI